MFGGPAPVDGNAPLAGAILFGAWSTAGLSLLKGLSTLFVLGACRCVPDFDLAAIQPGDFGLTVVVDIEGGQ